MSASHAYLDDSAHFNDCNGSDGPPPIDYRPLRDAARTAISWALDVARTVATEPDDREAIDRVERAALATVDGVPMCCRAPELRASHEDALITASILIERFEIDFRIPGLSQLFNAIYDAVDWTQRSVVPTKAPRTVDNHATHRHADATTLARALAAQLGHAPRVAHGEVPLAHVLVFPIR